MTSKSKDLIGSTPPLSSAESTAGQAQPSLQLASSDNTPISTQTTKPPSQATSSADNSADNSRTTLTITEKSRVNAVLARVALKQMETAGLIKRFKVLSADGQHPVKMRIEFDLALWTEDLELK